MPGGDAAIHHPWRLALGYVYALTNDLPELSWRIGDEERRIVRRQIDRGLNAPLTSAVGRLFDAVAALIGIRHEVTYEAQAAIEMEMIATSLQNTWLSGHEPVAYPFDIEDGDDGATIRLRRLIQGIQADVARGVSQAEIGWRFHWTMSEIIVTVCQRIVRESGVRTVALSGGCFQNRLLLALAVPRLEHAGFRVLLHRQVPCNDGGISLGQAVLAHFATPDKGDVHEVC
jgi:hydrogenase maturation protein HypF